MRNEKLSELIRSLELMKKLICMDLYMAIYDENCRVLYMYPDDGNAGVDGVRLGAIFEDPTGQLPRAIETGECIYNRLPSGRLGFELEGNIVPVRDQGETVGAVSITYVPVNTKSLEAQQVALQATYYLILSVDAVIGKSTELYKSYNPSQYKLQHSDFAAFREQTKEILHPEDAQMVVELTDLSTIKERLAGKKAVTCECRFRLANGEYRWIEVMMSEVGILNQIHGEEKYLFMVRDIHERRSREEEYRAEKQKLIEQLEEMNETLFHKEIKDEMTGMLNRNGMEHHLEQILADCMQPGYKLFVLVADLNSLKYINDNFGHTSGDNAICVLGDVLKKAAGDTVYCFRIGGDEFEVIGALPEEGIFAQKFIESLENGIEEYNRVNSLPYCVEVSYGFIFEKMSYKEDFEKYVQIADKRMYSMKRKMKQERVLVDSEGMEEEFRALDYGRDKILIADDDKLIRAVLRSFFRNQEIIVEAENGEEALQAIEGEDFSLICLDLNMPILDGFGVIDTMKERNTKNQAPVIMITATEDESVEERGYGSGVADFIKKPFNPTIAKHRIDNVLSLYKKQRQLEEMLKEKDIIVKYQVQQLMNQAKKLEGGE